MMPQVDHSASVIITTHNRYDYLVEAVRSASAQSLHPAEICIVDDGSDYSIEKQWKSLEPVDTDIPLHFLRTNDEGPAAARNAGARVAKGKYLAFLDDDDLMQQSYLEEALLKIQCDSSNVCVTWLRCFDDHGEWSGKHFPVTHEDCDPYERNIGIVGSNIVIARDFFQHIGGFDERLLGSEDKDFYIRLRAAEAKFSVLAKELILYRIHSAHQASGQFRFHPFQVSGKRLFLEKYAKEMSPPVYAKLAADAGLFRLMGGTTLKDRLSGFIAILRYDTRQLFVALSILVRHDRTR